VNVSLIKPRSIDDPASTGYTEKITDATDNYIREIEAATINSNINWLSIYRNTAVHVPDVIPTISVLNYTANPLTQQLTKEK